MWTFEMELEEILDVKTRMVVDRASAICRPWGAAVVDGTVAATIAAPALAEGGVAWD